MTEQSTMGRFLAALRKEKGLTQQQTAEKLGVSNKAVSRWERDETAPDISLLPEIAALFGVSCDELLGGGLIETEIIYRAEPAVIGLLLLAGTVTGYVLYHAHRETK